VEEEGEDLLMEPREVLEVAVGLRQEGLQAVQAAEAGQ
jgi:hypothetical protein